jgi:hypothetical protein
MSSNFDGSRNDASHTLELLPLSKEINYLAGTTADADGNFGEWTIENPGNATKLVLWLEAGQFRMRPGHYPSVEWTGTYLSDEDTDIFSTVLGDDHGFQSGDGPYLFQFDNALMPAGDSIVITTGPDEITRATGDFLEEGFIVGQSFTIAGSASNEGVEIVSTVTATVVGTVGTLTGEAAQTDVSMTGANLPLHGVNADETVEYFVRAIDDTTFDVHLTKAAAEDVNSTAVAWASDPEMTALTEVVIAAGPPGTFTRTVGSWIDEGFALPGNITVSGSASNEGDLVISDVTDLVLSVTATLTAEGAQTDLVIVKKAGTGGGTYSVGMLTTSLSGSPASGQTTDGYNSILIDAAKAQQLVIAAPARCSFSAVADAAVLAYWWVP